MENIVHAGHGVSHRLRVADITDVEFDLFGALRVPGLKLVAHIVLLLFVAGENADLTKIRVQEMFENGGTEGAGAAGDHEGGVIECGHFYFLLYRYVYATQHIQIMNCIVLIPLQNDYLSQVAFHAVRFHFLKICTL